MTLSLRALAARTCVVAAVASVVAVGAYFLWSACDVFFLAFAGVLVAILLRSLTDALRVHLSVSDGRALALILVSMLAVLSVAAWFMAARVSAQAAVLIETLPRAMDELRKWAGQSEWLQPLVRHIPPPVQWLNASGAWHRVAGMFSTTFGGLIDVLIVVFVGFYLAVDPHAYVRGFLRLTPVAGRARLADTLHAASATLRWWLVGRIGLMALNGVVTAVALWLLGVPLALTLGMLSGLLNFMPNIGPFVAGAPAVLIALMQGPNQALYVLVFYVAYQSLDGYLLTPLVTARTVSVPPAVTILAQVLLGVLCGVYGLLFASPLVAAGLVIVRKLYVEDVLNDRSPDSAARDSPSEA